MADFASHKIHAVGEQLKSSQIHNVSLGAKLATSSVGYVPPASVARTGCERCERGGRGVYHPGLVGVPSKECTFQGVYLAYPLIPP